MTKTRFSHETWCGLVFLLRYDLKTFRVQLETKKLRTSNVKTSADVGWRKINPDRAVFKCLLNKTTWTERNRTVHKINKKHDDAVLNVVNVVLLMHRNFMRRGEHTTAQKALETTIIKEVITQRDYTSAGTVYTWPDAVIKNFPQTDYSLTTESDLLSGTFWYEYVTRAAL